MGRSGAARARDERRRESRWRAALDVLGARWTLERCGQDGLASLLPLAIARAPGRAIARARGEWAGAPAQIVECETTIHAPGGEAMIVESLIVALDHPDAVGGAAIEVDPWTAYGRAPGTDPEIGLERFDRLYRVHAASEDVARASIPMALAEALVARRFRGVLEMRDARVIASWPEARLSPPAARSLERLGRAIAHALTRRIGGPYRGTIPRR